MPKPEPSYLAPLPWKIKKSDQETKPTKLLCAEGFCVAEFANEQNARYALHCVQVFPRMLDTLKRLHKEFANEAWDVRKDGTERPTDLISKAIQMAEGDTHEF